ncbi:LacI family DNA-binding transcriptional regulator [Pseudokineococcus marinus]|uniref:LacI family DNA-binding transcriptional regulator n=1 Tax=Pseudokineococcus marinus TaxID=351215 RepID=A0A849BQ82_9ACTN|nr:LacI family DNA-binding transcriptional regulator [Pseudokineococcus marinus]NNH22694.1 LacI family DNA-binding transcriptional regulator [Pseudokineococcus marinus]
MRMRLADVAVRAGVSEATVSRVLNDKPGVSQATRDKVRSVLDVLGYDDRFLPAPVAGLVGIVVPELTNPVFPALSLVVQTHLARAGYTPVVCSLVPGGVHEADFVRVLLQQRASGVVFLSGVHANTDADAGPYEHLRRRGLAAVFVNGWMDGIDAPFVSTDDASAVEQSVAHLVGLGHERVGLAMGPARYVPSIRKTAAFHDAVRRHLAGSVRPGEVDSLVVHTQFRIEGGEAAAHALLDRGVTGIVCGSDLMALGAVRAARERGLAVPEQVSVVGCDDGPLLDFTDPPLTTVHQDVDAVGTAAARALLAELRGEQGVRGELLVRPRLVVRASTAPPAARAPRPRRRPVTTGS